MHWGILTNVHIFCYRFTLPVLHPHLLWTSIFFLLSSVADFFTKDSTLLWNLPLHFQRPPPLQPTFLWFKAGLYKQTSWTFWLNQSKFNTKSDLIFFCNIKLVFGQRQNNVNKTLSFKKLNSETNSVANSWIICSNGGWEKSIGVEKRKREQREAMKEDTRKKSAIKQAE